MEYVISNSFQTNPESQQFEFQCPHEPTTLKSDSESCCALLIRHLPESIPHETLSRLFSHYGSTSVRPCTTSRLRNCAFVDFKNEALASQAQRHLHGLRFLGKVLSVAKANKPNTVDENQQVKTESGNKSLLNDVIYPRDLSERLQSGTLPTKEPIAARLGVDYPFPPHLKYEYPPPDGNILTNIVNALIAVPRLYTQVLHLMNKMNLPPPFRMALPTPPLPLSIPPLSPVAVKPHAQDLSSEESEMESSDEEGDGTVHPSVATSVMVQHRRKRARREAIVGPAVDKDVVHEAVGLKASTLVPKEIRMIKKKNPLLQIKIGSKEIQNENKDSIMKDSGDPVKESVDPNTYVAPEKLKDGKLPPEEILSLPMFKNYTAGNPASVLYIKNLAKDVVADDFYFIFGSLFGSVDAARFGLSVKLMQEGRMRGQAFVTFPSIELASHALDLVNGYVLKSKPMIIQFGRNNTKPT